MKLIVGHKYEYWYVSTWIYDGLFNTGLYKCDNCGKERYNLHWFHIEGDEDKTLKLGTECVKEMKAINEN